MKISGIDKDFEDIIYYLDSKGFKPVSSCDGVEKNHENSNGVDKAYISFLKSPKIINLMSEFLKDRDVFEIVMGSEDHFKPYELYGNIISGTTYSVYFSNRSGERTSYFENIIRSVSEKQDSKLSSEVSTLELLEKVLQENADSDLTFQVTLNGYYQPHMNKQGKINELTITTKSGNERVEGNIEIQDEKNMDALATILSQEYGINLMPDNAENYPEDEFIMPRLDKCSCSLYFKDEHLSSILDIIQYARQISHTIPTFESKEWIGIDEELYDELYDEELEVGIMELERRDERLRELEEEAKSISKEEQKIPELSNQREE